MQASSSSSYLSSLIQHSSSAMAAHYAQQHQHQLLQQQQHVSSPSMRSFPSHARSSGAGHGGRLSEQTAAAASASSLAAFLSSHSAAAAYAFDPTAAAAAASFLSKYSARPDVTTAAIVPLSPSSSAAAASSSPFSSHLLSAFQCSGLTGLPGLPQPPSSPSAFASSPLRLKSGSSCHQCKTNKEPPHLYFCTSKTDTAVGRRSCRKKYCVACMSRWYKALCHSGQPGLQQQQQQPYAHSHSPAAQGWSCPSCSGQCVCAACDRKKERANRKAAEGEAEAETDGAAEAEGEEADVEGGDGVVLIGCKRERELSDGSSGVEAAASPLAKLVKLESSPALSAAASSPSSSASGLADRKQSSPPALHLPRPPPAYSRLQSDPGAMAAFTSPRQPSAGPASRVQPMQTFSSASSSAAPTQAVASSLPPRPTGPSSAGRPPLPSPFVLPAAVSASPLYQMDGMHEAAVQVITRYFNSSLAAQQQQQAMQQQHQQRRRSDLEHLRRGSDDVPALLSFSSSSSSSSVSTPLTPNTPLMQPCAHQSYGQHESDGGLQLQLCSSSSSSSSSPPPSRAADKAQQLPSAALPMLFSAPRAVSTPVTGHETDRQIASRAMTMIAGAGSGAAGGGGGGGSEAFELSLQSRAPSLCQSPLTLSQFNSPTLRSPAFSLPASPRQALRQAQAALGQARPSATDGDVFSASAIFNPQLSLQSALSGMAGLGPASGGDEYPERGSPLLPAFWCKSAIGSLQSSPRHAASAGHSSSGGLTAHSAQQHHAAHSGNGAAAAMGEMEFQALFN